MKKFWNLIKTSVNGLVNRVGSDKLLHFLTGAWLTSLISPLGIWGMLVMLLFVAGISFIKEYYVDDKVEYKDIIAGVLGSVTSLLFWLIMV